MPLLPLHGHEALRARLAEQIERGVLPASLLLHGPAGVGKQRLALWLGQRLLCTGGDATPKSDESGLALGFALDLGAPSAPSESETPVARPCGKCQPCRYALELQHPDLHWFFPRSKGKSEPSDPSLEQVRSYFDELVLERVQSHGLYTRPDGSAGIHLSTVRLAVQMASLKPAMADRKVFIMGDADRMVSQNASTEAANAFLKLLEEPPPNTMVILTSSEPGALLPTIRSRMVSVRVAPIGEKPMRAFLAQTEVTALLGPGAPETRLRMANGAPGTLIGGDDRHAALARARELLEASDTGVQAAMRAAFVQGSSKSRGAFSDVLDALTVLLNERARESTAHGDDARAQRAVRAIPAVEEAKRAAEGNANPQLITARLLSVLAGMT